MFGADKTVTRNMRKNGQIALGELKRRRLLTPPVSLGTLSFDDRVHNKIIPLD